jgi:hypothetical protein
MVVVEAKDDRTAEFGRSAVAILIGVIQDHWISGGAGGHS